MRTCPTCGEYYEDGPLAFCLADGTPLADVDPSSEKWDEGARAVREKAERLSRHGRRLKWRRVTLRVLTTLLTTVVVCIVVINGVSVIYQSPPRDGGENGGTGGGGGGSGGDNSNDNDNDNDNDDDNDNDNDNSARCTAAEQGREWEAILGGSDLRKLWETAAAAERPEIIAEFAPRRVEPRLGRAKYDYKFSGDCTTASVTASYAWQVPTPTGDVSVPKTKKFTCRKKTEGVWGCGPVNSRRAALRFAGPGAL